MDSTVNIRTLHLEYDQYASHVLVSLGFAEEMPRPYRAWRTFSARRPWPTPQQYVRLRDSFFSVKKNELYRRVRFELEQLAAEASECLDSIPENLSSSPIALRARDALTTLTEVLGSNELRAGVDPSTVLVHLPSPESLDHTASHTFAARLRETANALHSLGFDQQAAAVTTLQPPRRYLRSNRTTSQE